MTWKRRGVQRPCYRCGDEGAEYCWLCHRFLCNECLHIDYEDHQKEAVAHGGNQR